MTAKMFRASIVVTFTALTLAPACAKAVRSTATAPLPAETLAQLWQMPDSIPKRDLFHGSGGASLAPTPETQFAFVAVDKTGYSPGFELRGPDGITWNVKTGPEAQPEIVASRVLWAIGYHQPPTYYLSNWKMTGGPAGAQEGGRFRPELPNAKVEGEWSWSENQFVGTQPFHGLIVTNLLLNSWDWKTSNNKIYRHTDKNGPATRYVVRDLGASLGKTSYPTLLKWFPMRGFGQGSRNDIDDFEQQGFIKRFNETSVEFDYKGIYNHVVDLVRPSDVRWAVQLLAQITDAQWNDAFRAANYAPDIRARYIKKIKAKIAEGLAAS
jgi:hypothetical protein